MQLRAPKRASIGERCAASTSKTTRSPPMTRSGIDPTGGFNGSCKSPVSSAGIPGRRADASARRSRSTKAESGFTQPQGPIQHGIENRREIAGRGVDNLQHLGGCYLPLQRLVTLGVALSKLTLEIGDGLMQIV